MFFAIAFKKAFQADATKGSKSNFSIYYLMPLPEGTLNYLMSPPAIPRLNITERRSAAYLSYYLALSAVRQQKELRYSYSHRSRLRRSFRLFPCS